MILNSLGVMDLPAILLMMAIIGASFVASILITGTVLACRWVRLRWRRWQQGRKLFRVEANNG